MSFSVGIVGLPNVGKSTLFKALTKNKVDIAAYPFTTIHPNYGTVSVPDERLEKIAQIIKPEKVTPTIIEFVDIAGLVKGAHKGEGLGNQFLAHIRNCDAILEVTRVFENPKVENVLGEINPEKEIEIVKVELLMKDLETLENLIPKVQEDVKRDKKVFKKLEFLKKIKEAVSQGKLISEIDLIEEEKLEIKEYQFLTQKPIFYVLNINNVTRLNLATLKAKFLSMNLKEEEEISELSESEKEELKLKSQLDQLILGCYNVLSLITFFTIAGGKETRAWTVKRQTPTPQAGAKVHSDFEKKFIRAEVIPWQKLVEAKSWVKARELGWLRTVGKDYLVEDGDIIEFKI
ncbi:MAG: redox-regulated ATPase YchF [bacterium]|nr:redox-regulated ATPase YchF [bacterium]